MRATRAPGLGYAMRRWHGVKQRDTIGGFGTAGTTGTELTRS